MRRTVDEHDRWWRGRGRPWWSTRPCSFRPRWRSGSRRTAGNGRSGRSSQPRTSATRAGMPIPHRAAGLRPRRPARAGRPRRAISTQAARRCRAGRAGPASACSRPCSTKLSKNWAKVALRRLPAGPPLGGLRWPLRPALRLSLCPWHFRLASVTPARASLRTRRQIRGFSDSDAFVRGPVPPGRGGQHERRESNPQPPVLETGALPIELRSYHVGYPDRDRTATDGSRKVGRFAAPSRLGSNGHSGSSVSTAPGPVRGPPGLHFFRDSLCAVCFRSRRQYFFSSSLLAPRVSFWTR